MAPNYDAMFEILSRPAILGALALLAAYALYNLVLRPSSPKRPDIPVLGTRPGELFSFVRARWRNASNIEAVLQEAYRKYKDTACMVPIAGSSDSVVLPLREYQWYVDQPDDAVSLTASIAKGLQLRYTVMDSGLMDKPVHHELIPRRLTREVGNLVPNLVDEISAALDDVWGAAPGETREVCVYTSMQRTIGRVTNRIFVGLPLCRDEALLANGIAYAQDVPLTSIVLRLPWGPLRPLVALFITIPNRIHTNRFYGILRSEVRRRLREYDNGGEEKTVPPNDFLQWSIHQAKQSGDPYLARPDTLAGRILLLNFASIHTSSFAITGVLLDLASSGAAQGRAYIDELREEISGVLAGRGGVWDKRALAEMPKLDSAMRESARINSFVPLASIRIVVAPGGVTTPSGLHLPRGTSVCTHALPVFHDPDVYPDPDVYRPFRFAEKRVCAGEDGGYVEQARQAFATTSTEFAAFGHGRHACPGRFFASSELKLMLAYVVMNYDFEFTDVRPKNSWVGVNRVPPMKATIRVTRRA